MPPSRSARRSSHPKSSYDILESLGERGEFDKQIQLFGLHGVPRLQVYLRNGDIVESGSCIEIDQGQDHSATSYKGERWFAKVIEIKGKDEDSADMELFLLCYWFYSDINVSRLGVTVGNVTRCPFSKNEFVLSNHKQVISARTIIRKAKVHFFDELDRNQPQIPKGEPWYRFNLRLGKGPVSTRIVLGTNNPLPPARCAVESCSVRYKPDEHRQRLCPRPGCGYWYHVECLENRGFLVDDKDIIRRYHLPSMVFGTQDFMNWKDSSTGYEYDHVPQIFYDMLKEGMDEENGGDMPIFPLYEPEVGSILNIMHCAQTPIKRGCKNGIVGNETIVTKARRALRELWDYRGEDGSFELYPNEDEVAVFKEYGQPVMEPLYYCMSCKGVI